MNMSVITAQHLGKPPFEWSTSRPLIDLILPGPAEQFFSWCQREGWGHALIDAGLLNTIFWAWDNENVISHLFESLKHSKADFIMVMCGDHHQYFLHNTTKKKDFWRSLPQAVVCHSIERVIGSPFPDSETKTRSALDTFDVFVYIDELSASLFEASGKPSLWIPQYVDEKLFRPTISFDERINQIFFRGQRNTCGLPGVYELRNRLIRYVTSNPNFCLSEAYRPLLTPAQAAELKARYRFVLSAPANCTGYSASLYEALACGCVVFQYALPSAEVKSNQLFISGRHFIQYNPIDPVSFSAQAEYACRHWQDYAAVAREGMEECLAKHTISIRLKQITDFLMQLSNRSTKTREQFTIIPSQIVEQKNRTASELDTIIPPEIKDDEFYYFIRTLSAAEKINTVLEIGSSAGSGSTQAFVTGLKHNPNHPTLYCMEISKSRFAELQKRYADEPFVKCYNISSIPVHKFPDETEVVDFYNRVQTGLNKYPLETVIRWLNQDVSYIRNAGVIEDGIQHIKEENGIEYFDMVLIDGSEFTGKAELEEVYGSRIILLDDINGFKNNENYFRLKNDPSYQLISENWKLRNGYAIFKKRDHGPLLRVSGAIDSTITNYSSISSSVETIQGHMLSGQDEFLFNLVKTLPENALIVEIGSYKGRSTVAMGYACIGTERKIYCIDTWDGNNTDFGERDFFNIWRENISKNGVETHVIPLRGLSKDILNRWNELTGGCPVDFVFIDGSHQFFDVVNDFYLTFSLVKTGGWIALHDVVETWPGPFKVWDEIARHSLSNHIFCSTLACGQKRSPLPGWIENTVHRLTGVPGHSAPTRLPIHFFTIVLNGQPFIQRHVEEFIKLPFPWHWHIIEGVADLKHDTAWSLNNGGRITPELHHNGLSTDGTTQYLNALKRAFPENITLYRKNEGLFWDGKLEMINTPLANIHEECLLFQVDVDEVWTAEQLQQVRNLFEGHKEKTAAFYTCNYFVGPDLIITSKNTYGNHESYEWLRTWRYKPGDSWKSHEPPRLSRKNGHGHWEDVAKINPFKHNETTFNNLIFNHYAYVIEEQLRFKEIYYGYREAVAAWKRLQAVDEFPVLLKDYFPWVKDEAIVDRVKTCSPGEIKNLVWIRTDAIGDNVLASSMLPYIRRRYPQAKITVVCQDHIAEWYHQSPDVDELVTFNRSQAWNDERYRNQLLTRFRTLKADLVLNSVYSRDALNEFVALSLNAPERIAWEGDFINQEPQKYAQYKKYYSRLIPNSHSKLEVERHKDFLKGVGIQAPDLEASMTLTDYDKEFAEKFFHQHQLHSLKTIALFAGAQYDVRIHSGYGSSLSQLCRERDLTILALGSESDFAVNQQNLDDAEVTSINLSGKITLRQSAALLSRCRLAVGAETGLAHISCAVQIPNVILLGGGHFGRFMPYSRFSSIICLPLECYGCNWHCRYSKSHCVKDLDPKVIAEAVRQTLESSSEKPRIFVQGISFWADKPGHPRWESFHNHLDITAYEVIPVGTIPLLRTTSGETFRKTDDLCSG